MRQFEMRGLSTTLTGVGEAARLWAVYLVTYNGSLSRLRWVRYEAGNIVAYPVGGGLI